MLQVRRDIRLLVECTGQFGDGALPISSDAPNAETPGEAPIDVGSFLIRYKYCK